MKVMIMLVMVVLVAGKADKEDWAYCVDHKLDQGMFCGSYIEHVTLYVGIPFSFDCCVNQYPHTARTDSSEHVV